MEDRKAELQNLGYKIRDNIIEAVSGDREEQVLEDLRRRLFVSLSFVLPLLIFGWTENENSIHLAIEIVLVIPIIIVNHRVFIDGFAAFHSRRPEKNTLAAIGTIASLAMLQFVSAGIFLTTMALCRWTEAYIRCKLDEHLKNLVEAEPDPGDIGLGDVLTIAPGEVIPADGRILSGKSAINEEIITGERVPPEKGKGEPAFAGTVNLSSEIKIKVTRRGEDTTISRIIDHITASIGTRPPISERAEKAGRIVVLSVIVLAVLASGIWIASGSGPVNGVMTGVTILIIASPYAFSVGIPMSILAATVCGAKEGIMIRSADILELARDINTIAMNKTGTVTVGRPQISDVLLLDDGFTLRIAGALEKKAKHPAGKEILKAAEEQFGQIEAAEDVVETPGRGISGIVDGKKYYGGNATFMQEKGIFVNIADAEPLFRQGKSVVFFANESRLVGLVALRDAPKPVSLKAITRIEGMGIDVVMLTGDSLLTAEAIRNEVGIDEVYAEIRPEEKAQVIDALRGQDEKLVAMVGDGIDDADAITRADMGIAIGTGPEIDVRPADVILIEDDLMDVVRAIFLSRQTMRGIRQNIAFAYVYNIVAAMAAAGVLVPLTGPVFAPVIAALCMCASQLLVAAHALRVKSILK